MKIKISKVLSLSLVAMLASAMFVGCSGDSGETTPTDTSTPDVTVPATPPVDEAPDMGVEGEMPAAPSFLEEPGPLGQGAFDIMETMFGEGAGMALMYTNDTAYLTEMFGLPFDDTAVIADLVLAQPMMNVQYQTYLAVQAQEGKVSDVEALLTRFREEEVVRVGPPDPYAHVGNRYLKAQASQILTIGDTVYFVAMGNDDNLGEEPALEAVQAEVQATVDILKASVEGGADAVVAAELDMSVLPQVGDMSAGDMGVGDMNSPTNLFNVETQTDSTSSTRSSTCLVRKQRKTTSVQL